MLAEYTLSSFNIMDHLIYCSIFSGENEFDFSKIRIQYTLDSSFRILLL